MQRTRIRIEYAPDVPSEYRDGLEPLINKWIHVLPSWVRRLRVDFSGDTGSVMSTCVYEEYRKLVLMVHPPFLNVSQEDRELTVVHEFAHAIIAPVNEYTKRLIDDLTGGEGEVLYERCRKEFIDRMESSVEDMAWALIGYGDEVQEWQLVPF